MQGMHIHRFGWVHPHKPDWHTLGIRFDHMIHDPRFWAALALAVLLGAMILATILSESTGGTPKEPIYPTYPYMP